MSGQGRRADEAVDAEFAKADEEDLADEANDVNEANEANELDNQLGGTNVVAVAAKGHDAAEGQVAAGGQNAAEVQVAAEGLIAAISQVAAEGLIEAEGHVAAEGLIEAEGQVAAEGQFAAKGQETLNNQLKLGIGMIRHRNCLVALYSLTQYSAIFAEVKGYFGITAPDNQLGRRSLCSLKSKNRYQLDNQLEVVVEKGLI